MARDNLLGAGLALLIGIGFPILSWGQTGPTGIDRNPPIGKALIDDALRASSPEPLLTDLTPIAFPEWLQLKDGRPLGPISLRGVNREGTRLLIATETLDEIQPVREFTIELGEPLKVKATRYFPREDAHSFSQLFPQFAEYAEAIPERQGDIELGLWFTASVRYEFVNMNDLQARAPELYQLLSPSFQQMQEVQQRHEAMQKRLREIIEERAKVLDEAGREMERDDD